MTGAKGKFSVEPLRFNVPHAHFHPNRHLPPFPSLPEPSLPTRHSRPAAVLVAVYLTGASQKLPQWEAHILLSPPV